MDIISVKNLNYKSLFKDLNLNFTKNKIIFISGSNKCGKTTLIKLLSSMIVSENTVYYNNKDINLMSSYDFSTKISTLILYKKIEFNFSTLNQELLFKLDKLDIDEKEKKQRYDYFIKLFDLKNDLYTNINELSFIKKTNILLVKALITKPKVLLLDDLFLNLNEKDSIDILKILKSIDDLTIISTINTLEFADQSDYMYILSKGKLILGGKTIEVLKEDSLLNKIGLELPFMVDLSIKLKYYDLLSDIELNMERMVNILWK